MLFIDKITKAIDFLEERDAQPDTGMAMAGGIDSAQTTPPSGMERARIDRDLHELFAIKTAAESPNSPVPDKTLRQRLWDVEDRWGLHAPTELRP